MQNVPDHKPTPPRSQQDQMEMTFTIIMPIHNEADHLERVLRAYEHQVKKPNQLILVNDGSTDQTQEIIDAWSKTHHWIDAVHLKKDHYHAPGTKVVQAFDHGRQYIKGTPDLIGKFDADIALPPQYFETLLRHFSEQPALGMASGLLYIYKDHQWQYEGLAKTTKIRGPVKLYRTECFDAIGGLRPCIGWDSIDQWLALYFGWKIQTYADLHVKHLKPTGANYQTNGQAQQGIAYASMRYGLVLAFLSLAKLALFYKRLSILSQGLKYYWQNRSAPLISAQQGAFVRRFLWKAIFGVK